MVQRHSHFFTADGKFGSLDQNEQQVDDGTYRLSGTGRFRLGEHQEETFTYRIEGGDRLMMEPVISERMKMGGVGPSAGVQRQSSGRRSPAGPNLEASPLRHLVLNPRGQASTG